MSEMRISRLHPRICLWMLRLIKKTGYESRYIQDDGQIFPGVAAQIGYEVETPGESQVASTPGNPSHAVATIHGWLERAEAERDLDPGFPVLSANLERIAKAVGLDEVDVAILEFVTVLNNHLSIVRMMSELSVLLTLSNPIVDTLCGVLKLPRVTVRRALSNNSLLVRSGLLRLDNDENDNPSLTDHAVLFQLGGMDLAFRLYHDELQPADVLEDVICASPAANLTLADYAHIDNELRVLQPYLAHVLQTRRPGVNIFIHGIPGTGKTELARTLAQVLDCVLYEVAHQDPSGKPLNSRQRLQATHMAQFLLKQPRAMLLFDEAEDIFQHPDHAARSDEPRISQAWLNRTLEHNTVPTLWISNSRDGMNPAFARRFDLVFELEVPPRVQRARILQAHSRGLLAPAHIDRLAVHTRLSPAVVARAASVVGCIQPQLDPAQVGPALELLLNHSLQAQGHDTLPPARSAHVLGHYDLQWVNTKLDLTALTQGIQQSGSARLCLCGPSGTGKTAWARWLADSWGRPLLVQRGSDLLGRYLGDSERQIATAFEQAQADQAVLLIDEIDGLLAERDGNAPHWHASIVNEMLTQMEQFEGVLLTTTNRVQHLDAAALRRFDLTIRFDFLRPEQTEPLFAHTCTAMGLGTPAEHELAQVRRLRHLTPGDFAAVQRQHRFQPLRDVAGLIAALGECCQSKNLGTSERIGFL